MLRAIISRARHNLLLQRLIIGDHSIVGKVMSQSYIRVAHRKASRLSLLFGEQRITIVANTTRNLVANTTQTLVVTQAVLIYVGVSLVHLEFSILFLVLYNTILNTYLSEG